MKRPVRRGRRPEEGTTKSKRIVLKTTPARWRAFEKAREALGFKSMNAMIVTQVDSAIRSAALADKDSRIAALQRELDHVYELAEKAVAIAQAQIEEQARQLREKESEAVPNLEDLSLRFRRSFMTDQEWEQMNEENEADGLLYVARMDRYFATVFEWTAQGKVPRRFGVPSEEERANVYVSPSGSAVNRADFYRCVIGSREAQTTMREIFLWRPSQAKKESVIEADNFGRHRPA